MIRFENMSPEVWQAMCTPMHQILAPSSTPSMGGLYLGSMTAVHDQDLLKEQAITHFVQVHEVPWLPNSKDGNNYYRIDILDSCSTDLRPHLEAACDYIDQALKTGRNVLVHCQQGVSRSPAIVIAYLIRNHGMTFDAAHALLKRKRACINPNAGFVKVLKEWEQVCRRPGAVRRFTT